MKKLRRILAALLCVCMMLSGGNFTTVAAEFSGMDAESQKRAEETATDSDATEDTTEAEDTETAEPVGQNTEPEDAEAVQGLLQYIYIDSPVVSTPGTQKVLAGLGDNTAQIESATLYYRNNSTGAGYQAEAEYLDSESALFGMEFPDSGYAGGYILEKITYVVNGVEYSIDISETGIAAVFGVDCDVNTNPDDVVDETPETPVLDGVVITDADGNAISEADLEDAVIAASDGKVRAGNNGKIVVVLDAGHGNEGDTGAVYTWNGVTYIERDLNLKIAQYCKAALEQYTGVTVYMTRTDVNNGLRLTPPEGESVGELVKYAQSVNADILVSIHNNSATVNTAHGSEVYYPNANYNPDASATGKGVADKVLEKLKALGLASRGAKIRNEDNPEGAKYPYYPDGSQSDYYGIIRQAKECGFPGIIIEHAFLTNESDATNFLGSDEALKRLGEADAEAIAEFFGLTTDVEYEDGDAAVRVAGGPTQYTLVASGVPEAKGVVFGVYSKETGVTKEYGAIPGSGDGCWYSNFDISDFGAYGEYTVTAYVRRTSGSKYKVGATGMTVDLPKTKISAFDADGQKTYILIAENLFNADKVKSVRFGVWNQGLGDLHWYTAQKQSDGRWLALMPIADYKKAGTYYTDAYATYADGEEKKIGSATYRVTNPSTDGIVVQNADANHGTFDIVIKGVKAASGVTSVRVPVWTASDLSDLYWYNAEKQDNGSYLVHADIKNHKYNYGVYAMQSYVMGGNGIEKITSSYCYNFKEPTANIYPFNADNENNYILVAEGISGGSRVTGVRYEVQKRGTSDIYRYEGSKDSLGRWLSVVGVSGLKGSGTYDVRANVTTSDGKDYKVGETSFNITQPTANISIQNVNETAGTFDVIIKDVVSPSGISEIRVPAWTAADLNDIHWYTAVRQSDGTYKVTVEVANHKGNHGVYAIQACVTANNGIYAVAASMCYRFVPTGALYKIVGATSTSVEQMVAYYKASATYPEFYQSSDAPTIEDFCQIYMEECAAEGIKAEVAFCQSMKETGFLRYGGAVKIEQFNFAGIGATDSGGTPATFGSVREGIRAQVQHLKAYAATSELANPCVDPRFSLVTRGCAEYVEWLGIQENPNGKGWASAPGYGYSLKSGYIDKLLSY